jgi:hypothetical protein
MKYAFLFSGIVELLGALFLYFYPELIFEVETTGVSKLYGMAVFALGLVNVFAFQHYGQNAFFKKFFLLMMGYHAALAMICFGIPTSILSLKIAAMLTHLLCFVVFFITYMKDLGPERS